MSFPQTNHTSVHYLTVVGIFTVIWLCWLVFHNEAHLHMYLWCPWRWRPAKGAHRRGNSDVLGQFLKWHNHGIWVDHWDFGLTQGTCQSKNWHTVWFKRGRIHYISYVVAMNPMRCLKFKGHWTVVYHQFLTGRLDRSHMENLISGPPASDYI